MKKLINSPEQVVRDMLDGMVAAHPHLLKNLPGTQVIVRADAPVSGKVGLVSGGGSGHEPAHAGYVGKGMLDAAVAGEVFTSHPDQVLEAIKAVDSGNGVLLIIKNYTGDVMNFEMAAELAEAEGIRVAKVVVNDDVAVENSTYTTGRRGIAGTVFVHKIAGALASRGASLEEVEAVADKVIRQVRSMGMALTPCIVPAAGTPGFQLGEDEIEIGLGIRRGARHLPSKLMTAEETARTLLVRILEDLPLSSGEKVAVMIERARGNPADGAVHREQDRLRTFEGTGHRRPQGTFVGPYMTSLEMAGCSITLLKLDEELTDLLDAPARTAAWNQ